MTDEKQPPKKLQVPEPSAGMGTGFLTEYWQSREALPRIKGPEVWWYFLQRGVRTLVSLPMSSMIAVFTIAVSLFLLAGFLLILQNVGHLLSEAGNTLYVTAYIADDANSQDIRRFVEGLQHSSNIRSVEFVSKEEALRIFRKDLGPKSTFLSGLEENNPLPASVEIVFRPDPRGRGFIEEIVKKLRKLPLIDDVVFGSEWVDKMQAVIKVFRLFGIVSLLIALAVIVFLIANTIKLIIYARRDEIAIMQLVGASDDFVRIPFVIGGLLEGLIGSVFGLAMLQAGFALLNYELRSSRVFGIALPDLAFLNPWALVSIVCVGLVVGAVGSLLALGKFMNV